MWRREKGVFSILSHVARESIESPDDLERFLKHVVDGISSIIKSGKISLVLRTSEGSAAQDSYSYRYSISIPMVSDESGFPVGSIVVDREDGAGITGREFDLLSVFASLVALKIQKYALEKALSEGLVSLLKSFVRIVEARDRYTRFHSQRVAEYSLGIAEVLGLSEEEKDVLKTASLIHDIGKLAVPDTILLKPGRLTDEEFNVVKQHVIVGAEILRPIKSYRREMEIVLYHHERWDGSGYPDGLVAGEIPFLARIVAVADSFDAMTSDRVYRRAMSFQKAYEELKKLAGIKYGYDEIEAFEVFLLKKYNIRYIS